MYKDGDIDNRIKGMLDALRMPSKSEIGSANLSPQQGEAPFFTLLEDDALVTSPSVETDYLLEPGRKDDVLLLLDVKVEASSPMPFHWGLV
jgi:hypothetical protein